MTPEEITHLIRSGKNAQVVESLVALDEQARKKLSTACRAARKAIRTGDGKFSGRLSWEHEQAVEGLWNRKNPHAMFNADLAVLACCPKSDCSKVPFPRGHHERDKRNLIVKIFARRKPEWLTSWVCQRLEGEWPEIDFKTVRELYDIGAIDKPDSDGYVRLLVAEMVRFNYREPEPHVPLSERLLECPDYLRDDVWRLFDCENQAFQSDHQSNWDRAPSNYETWPQALLKLCDDGHLDRSRLLDSSLHGMTRELKQNYLTAYGRFFDALSPTLEELEEREEHFVALLTHPTGPVVTFAVRALAKLQKGKRLDGARYLKTAAPVFSQKAKGSAIQALKIAVGLLHDEEALADRVFDLATAGLSHPNADVQELALEVCTQTLESAQTSARELFERQIANLPAKLQTKAWELVGGAGDGEPPELAVEEERELAQAISALPENIAAFVGLGETGGRLRMPTSLQFDRVDLPRLPNAESIVPLDSTDALLEHAARLVEVVDSPDQIEQLLDGIVRLGNDRGGNFDRLAAPIKLRLEQPSGGSSRGLGSYWSGLPLVMADLLMTWLSGRERISKHSRWHPIEARDTFAAARLREIQKLVSQGNARQLLATPTHSGGWIDPNVFVERLSTQLSDAREIPERDFRQALLRLSPVGRSKALERAKSLRGDSARIARFALGSAEGPSARDRGTAHLWFCAARARDPFGDIAESLKPIATEIPGVGHPLASISFSWHPRTRKSDDYELHQIHFDHFVQDAPNEEAGGSVLKKLARRFKREPTLALEKWPIYSMQVRSSGSWASFYEFNSAWRIEWFGMQWPQNTEPYFQIAAMMLDQRLDDAASTEMPIHHFLNALFDSSRRWGGMAHLALCLGLVSRSADAKGYAIDATLSGLDTGQLEFDILIDTLRRLLEGGILKLNRLADSLTEVAQASPHYAFAVARIVDALVGKLNAPPKNAHFLYSVALESMAPLALTPSNEMKATLRKLKGASKAAKLARELLSLEGNSVDAPPQAVIADLVKARLDIASSLAG